MEFEIIRNIDELEAYKGQWKKILIQNNNNNPFIEYEWIRCWWGYFGKYHELFVIIIRLETEIIGFGPFMLTKERFCSEVNFIGYNNVSYMDLVISDPHRKAAVEGLVGYLIGIKKNYVLNLHGLAENGADFKLLKSSLENRGQKWLLYQFKSRYIDTSSGDFNSFFQGRRFHDSIRNIARYERRLKKLGDFTFRKLDAKNIDGIFMLHDKRWYKKNDISGFSKGDTREYFRQLALEPALPFEARADGLFLNERLIAFTYCIGFNKRIIVMRIAHDDIFATYSPGKVILKENIRQCFEGHNATYEFGVGGFHRYKAEWTDTEEIINQLIFPAKNPLAKLAFNLYMFYEVIKKILRKNEGFHNFKVFTLGVAKHFLSIGTYISMIKSVAGNCNRKKLANLLQYCYLKWNKGTPAIYHKQLNGAYAENDTAPYRLVEANMFDIEKIMELMHHKASEVLKRLEKGQKCAKLLCNGDEIAWLWLDDNMADTHAKQDIHPLKKGAVCVYDCWMVNNIKKQACCNQVMEGLACTIEEKGYQNLFYMAELLEKHIINSLARSGFKKVVTDKSTNSHRGNSLYSGKDMLR